MAGKSNKKPRFAAPRRTEPREESAPTAPGGLVVKLLLAGVGAVALGVAAWTFARPVQSASRPQPASPAAPVVAAPPATKPAAPASGPAGQAESDDDNAREMAERAKRFRETVRRAAYTASRPASARPRDPRPPPDVNVVVFLIDTLRADRLGAYGYKNRPTSPYIDQLAREGVRFENAYAAAPWTLPSVASLFTSTCICRHNTISRRTKLGVKIETLSEKLDRCGYDTYALYANGFLNPKFGLTRGFDFFAASPRNNALKVGAALGPDPDTPLFLYVHNLEPHNPYHFAPPHTDGFRDVKDDVRARMRTHYDAWKKAVELDFHAGRDPGSTDVTEELEGHIAALNEMREDYSELYDASVRFADTHVGSTVKKLRDLKIWRKTLFIILSDHGEELGDHGGWLHDQSVYEEMLRVPLIIRFPAGEFAGKVVTEPVSLVDVLPTVMEYLGRSELTDQDAQGHSLMPLVRGQAAGWADEPIVVGMRVNVTNYYKKWREARGDVNIALRLGNWKGIWNVQPDTFELYDLVSDPRETSNRAGEHPAIVERLLNHARLWLDDCRSRSRDADDAGPLDEETRKSLNAIGYVE